MSISDHFSAADVLLDVSARNKRNLLDIMATEAAIRLRRTQQEVVEALQAREELGSTALGKGVALPHAQLAGALAPLVLFVRLDHPIYFDAHDAEPIDLVFLALWPADETKGLLDTMSDICRALRNPHLLRSLRFAQTAEDVAELLRHQETTDLNRDAAGRKEE